MAAGLQIQTVRKRVRAEKQDPQTPLVIPLRSRFGLRSKWHSERRVRKCSHSEGKKDREW